MNSKRHNNEETWSRGANSRLPFAVNGLSFTETLWNNGSLGGFFYLEDRALRNALSYSCAKLVNRDFVSNFAERIQNRTLWFY